jgi:hypothetical protein
MTDNNKFVSLVTVPKRCSTCGHCRQTWFGDECLLTYRMCYAQRTNPTGACDENFSGWYLRPSVWHRIVSLVCWWGGLQ